MERCNVQKMNDVESKRQEKANISNMFTNLENTDSSIQSNKLDINNRPVRENIIDNVEIWAQKSLWYHNILWNKQWSD